MTMAMLNEFSTLKALGPVIYSGRLKQIIKAPLATHE